MLNRMAIVAVFAGVIALASAVHATDPPGGGNQSMTLTPTKARVVVMEDIGNANFIGAAIVKKLSALNVVDEYIVNTKNRFSHAPSVSLLVGQGESGIISRGSGLLQLESNKVDTIGFARGSPRANDTTITSVFGYFDSGGGGSGNMASLVSGANYTERIEYQIVDNDLV